MADDLAQAASVVATKAEETPASTSNDNESKVEPEVEVQKTIEQLLEDGAHALAMGKFAESCEHYAFAVEKLVEKHGEMAIETVDALEAYGNALLKNGIASSAVLGGDAAKEKAAVPDASATASTSVPAAASASASSSKAIDPPTAQSINFHFGGDGPDDDEEEEAEGDDHENGEDGDENEAAEEADDFETAWEVLDTARAILSKQETKERKLQLARVHSSMAEVATEAGRPEDGVKEYETALSIQSSLLEPYDRLVAQTHLFIALALELVPTNAFDSNQEEGKNAEEAYTKAIQHVEQAKQVLKNREHFLKGIKVDSKGKGKEGAAASEEPAAGSSSDKQLSEKEQEEVKDIEELQVELDNKVEDLKAQIVEAQNKKGSLQDQLYEAKPSLPENVSKEVHNLNNLVKKKPKKQDAVAETNGHASKEETVTNGKRKAEDEVSKENGEDEKKVKVSS